MIILERRGFYASDWNGKRRRHVSKPVNLDSLDLLDRWEDAFTIKGTVTFGDLVRLIAKEFSPALRDIVGRIARANFPAYLADEELLPRRKRRANDLAAIEVYLCCELDVGGRRKQEELEIHSSAHGLARPNKDGHKSYAIEFTPWADLLHLPLEIRPGAYFTTTRWRRMTKKEQTADEIRARETKKKNRSSVWMPNFPYTLDATEQKDVKMTMSLGEFLVALFDEVCFFSSPARRDDEKADLLRVAKQYKKSAKKAR